MEDNLRELQQAEFVAAHKDDLTVERGVVEANPTPHPAKLVGGADRFDFSVVGYTPDPDDPDPDPWPWEPHDAGSKHRYMATDDYVLDTGPHDDSCLVVDLDALGIINPDSM
ncbi:MAG: hypothetical protein AAFN27_00770 [Pseudomonadota bacterium]